MKQLVLFLMAALNTAHFKLTPFWTDSGEKAPIGIYNPEPNPAIVKVQDINGGHGTGFFVKLKGGQPYLITAAHVCGTNTVMYSEKGAHRVLYSMPLKDTCILETYSDVATLDWGGANFNGQDIRINGFPYNYEHDEQKGSLTTVSPSFFVLPRDYYGACQTVGGQELFDMFSGPTCVMGVTGYNANLLTRPGNSGGPVLNRWGNVVGIIIGTDNNGHGILIPLSSVLEVVKDSGLR